MDDWRGKDDQEENIERDCPLVGFHDGILLKLEGYDCVETQGEEVGLEEKSVDQLVLPLLLLLEVGIVDHLEIVGVIDRLFHLLDQLDASWRPHLHIEGHP